MKVLFLGSSHFSNLVLDKMLEMGADICGVVTSEDKPSGRGQKLSPNEVKTFAQSKGLKVYTFDKIRNHMDEVKQIDYDIALVASFGQILPEEFLNHRLAINVHPSLLPKYRGASPIQSAILNREQKSGVTIMKVAKEVDSGDIILQSEVQLNGEYYSELEAKFAELGGELAFEAIKMQENGTIKFIPQDGSKATFTSKFSKEDGILNLEKSGEEIASQVRALGEETGCYLKIGETNLKIFKADATTDELEQGKVLDNKKRFVVGCKKGAIEIISCQSPSGKVIAGRDYLNGHNNILGKSIYDI